MEEQAAKIDAEECQQNDSSLFQPVLKKGPKGRVNNPKTDTACKSVFYDSLAPEGCITNEESRHLDKSDGDEEQPTKSSDTEQHNVSKFMQSDGQRNDIPLLESMLKRLMSPKKSSKPHHVKSHGLFYHSVESEGCTTNEDGNDLDSTHRSDGDEDQPTKSSDLKDGNEAVEESPDEFPKWERRIFFPVPLPLQNQVAEVAKIKKEPSMNEERSDAALLHNNPSQPSKSDLPVSLDRVDSAQMETKHELLDEACGGPSNLSMDTSNPKIAESIPVRTERSASEPVRPKPKEERPLSAPSVLNQQEYDSYSNPTTQKSFSKVAAILGWEDSGITEHDNSLTKTQKKGVKSKMKHLTQKLMEKFKDKQDCEHTSIKSAEDSVEEEMEGEDPDIPPPIPPKKGKYVFLDRKFTLKDFKLNIEPINLMEEIFTGDEWLNYLPSKPSPEDKDTSDQSIPYDVPQLESDHQVNVLVPIPEQDQSEDNQESVNDAQQDKAAEVNSHMPVVRVESDASIFAIPKALLTNNAIKQMVFGTDCAPKKSDDVYERVDMYIIPKNDIPISKGKPSEVPSLDFSAIKSSALLDNSALKSRIRLSKKRPHRPPKKHKKVKTEKSNARFYKIPSVILKESPLSLCLPHHSIPFSTSPRLPTKITPAQ